MQHCPSSKRRENRSKISRLSALLHHSSHSCAHLCAGKVSCLMDPQDTRGPHHLHDPSRRASVPPLLFPCKWVFCNLVSIIHFLQMSLIKDRQGDARLTFGTARNGEAIPAGEQKIQPSQNALNSSAKSQQQLCGLTTWLSPSKNPANPTLWWSMEVHGYGESCTSAVWSLI